MPRRSTPDWALVGWPYRLLHPIGAPYNRLVARVGVEGVSRFPVDAASVMVVANHLTYWDPVFISAVLDRPVNWIGQELTMRGSALRRAFFRAAGVIPVDRQRGGNEGAIREAVRRLGEGRVVGIFPEGRLAPSWREPLPPRSGVGRLALATGARIVPCALRTERFWPRGARVVRFRAPVRIRFGPVFRLPADAEGANDPQRAKEATEAVWSRVLALRRGLDADVGDGLTGRGGLA